MLFACCLFYLVSENKMLVIKFDVNWNVHRKHISFMALFYLPTLYNCSCWLQLQLGLLGAAWATLAAFPHCAARTLFIVPGNNTSGSARALGALESAGADNNSYMWHDEFLATRRSFLLVSLSCHTPGHFLWTQLGRKTKKEAERERGRDRERANCSVLLSTNVVIAAQVSWHVVSHVFLFLLLARSVCVSF